MKSTLIGVLGSIVITYLAITYTTTNYLIYWNMVGVIIVLGGSLCASIVTVGVKEVFSVFILSAKVITKHRYNTKKVIQEVIDTSYKLNKDPSAITSVLNEDIHPFFKDGLILVQNSFEKQDIIRIMKAALRERMNYQKQNIEHVRILAKYPPSFGMIGTVIGLVAILQSLGGANTLDNIGPSMAVALVTTLYGLFLANYIFIPISDNLTNRMEDEFRLRKIIIDGLTQIIDGDDALLVQESMMVHLLPKERFNYLEDRMAWN
jgi:chemotaxis protein MotA